MHMKKFIALLMAALMIFALAACSKAPATDDTSADGTTDGTTDVSADGTTDTGATGITVADIQAKGKLVVGTEAQYPPYEFKDADGNIIGFDMWLAQKIADKLGVTLEVQDMAFDGIIPAIQTKAVDLGIAGFSPTPERQEAVDFTKIYYKGGQSVLIAAKDSGTYTTVASLSGQKVGAQKGAIQETIAKEQFSDSELLSLDKVPNLVLELKSGNIAGVIMETAVAKNYAKSNPDLVVSEIPVTVDESTSGTAACAPKGSTELIDYVNTVIDEVTADGSFDTAVEDAFAKADEVAQN